MELLLDRFDDPTKWIGATVVGTMEFEDYMVDDHFSTSLMFTGGSIASFGFSNPVSVEGYKYLSFSASSLSHGRASIDRPEDAEYCVTIDNVPYFVPIPRQFSRVTIPLEGVTDIQHIEIVPQFDGVDTLIIADLRVWTPELPSDLLRAIKSGIEKQILLKGEKLTVGEVSCRAGDRHVTIEQDWTWLEHNVVLLIGTELHQVANRVDNKVSFLTTYSGDMILADYTGEVFVIMPVEIGYYDREAALPGVALWYNSPQPTERHGLSADRVLAFTDTAAYIEREGSTQSWRVSVEIAARSPQLISIAGRCVRAYLAQSKCWVNGTKIWWFWKDATADMEPVEDYDIVPRSTYVIDVEIQEEVFEWQKLMRGSPRITVTGSVWPRAGKS